MKVDRIRYEHGNNPQHIRNMIPTGTVRTSMAFPPVKTSTCNGIKIVKAKKPVSNNKELNKARNTFVGNQSI